MGADNLELGGLTLGQASGVVLFLLGLGIALWPLAARLVAARRARAGELRTAFGAGGPRK